LEEGLPRVRSVSSAHGLSAVRQIEGLPILPKVFIFDLDDTVWEGDIDMTGGPPFLSTGEGLVASKKGGSVHLFRDVLEIFGWLHEREHRAAVASHTSTPRWAETALSLLQTCRGATLAGIAGVKEMHGACKTQHLKRIATRVGCCPEDMVFFDNAYFNIVAGDEAQVTSCHTPRGLSWNSFAAGCAAFAARAVAGKKEEEEVASDGDGGAALSSDRVRAATVRGRRRRQR